MSHNKNYFILFGSLAVFFIVGILLMTSEKSKVESTSSTPVKQILNTPKEEEVVSEIKQEVSLTEEKATLTSKIEETKTPKSKQVSVTEPVNDFLKVDQVSNVKEKVQTILNQIIPEASKYRKLDLAKFNSLLLFAYSNFTSIIPSDKKSDDFIDICNQRNELFHQLKKSNLTYDSRKIDNLCL